MAITTNTTFLPTLTRSSQTVDFLARNVDAPGDAPGLRHLKRIILELRAEQKRQEAHIEILKLALDDALRALHQRIDQRPAVGPIADRPSPAEAGMFLSTDQTPEVLYVSANDVWHGINTDS